MADLEPLRSAIQALFPEEVNPRFVQVPKGTEPPWTNVSISLPTPQTRAMSTRVLTFRIPIRVRIVGANDLAIWQLADILRDTVEGSRVVCDGWTCSPVQQLNTFAEPYEDRDVTLTGTNAHPVILPLDFDFHANVKETP